MSPERDEFKADAIVRLTRERDAARADARCRASELAVARAEIGRLKEQEAAAPNGGRGMKYVVVLTGCFADGQGTLSYQVYERNDETGAYECSGNIGPNDSQVLSVAHERAAAANKRHAPGYIPPG